VRVRGGAICSFRTCLTGELYGLLVRHSIVGRLIPAVAERHDAAFERGVRDALAQRPGGLLHDVFTARSAVLLGHLGQAEVADYLSGLLIGHELREQLALIEQRELPVLVGEDALVARYQRAFGVAGVPVAIGDGQAALHGLVKLATLASESTR
jgi:2-dehydro-3-deoxygalactonokinase